MERERDSYTTGAQLRDPNGDLTEAGIDLGRQRLGEFFRHQAMVQAELLSLTLSTAYAAKADYSDASLENMATDARDLCTAASGLAAFIEELAEQWRAQRDTSDE